MSDEFDPFQGGTGLKDNFDGTIIDAAFYKDPERSNYSGQLTVRAFDGEDVEIRYGLGGDWASYDGGETVEHPKGPRQLFNNRSAYYDFFHAALEAGAEQVLRQRGREYSDLGPRHAGIWKGLTFHFDVVQRDSSTRDKETGEWKDIQIPRILPTKYLGVHAEGGGDQMRMAAVQEASGASGSPAPSEQPARTEPSSVTPAPAPTSGNVGDGGGLGLGTADWARLRVLASAMSYDKFVDQVMALTDESGKDMIANAALMQRLADEAFYQSLKG